MYEMLLMSAFDSWKKDQLDEKYIGAVYSMLAEKGKVLPKFPIEYLRKGLPADTLKVRYQRNREMRLPPMMLLTESKRYSTKISFLYLSLFLIIFYLHYRTFHDNKRSLKIEKAHLKSVLGQVMFQDPTSTAVTDEDVLSLVNEIACSAKGTSDAKNPYITWKDFSNLFKI